MSWNSALPILILLSSLLPGILIFWLSESRSKVRAVLNLFGAVIKLGLVAAMLYGVYHQQTFEIRWVLAPGLERLHEAAAQTAAPMPGMNHDFLDPCHRSICIECIVNKTQNVAHEFAIGLCNQKQGRLVLYQTPERGE